MNASLPFDAVELWHIAGWTMIHFLWLGTIVAAVAFLLRLATRRAAPNVRYAAALACLFALAALPLGIAAWLVANSEPITKAAAHPAVVTIDSEANTPIIELSDHEAASVAPLPTESASLPDATVDAASRALPPPPSSFRLDDPLPLAPRSSPLTALETCVPYLPWLWLLGTPLTFALLAAGLVGTRRLRRASRPIDDGQITELLARLRTSLRVTRRVTIAVCDRIAAPVLVGILRPAILVPPAALTGWTTDEIEMVLLHELAHVRRWDNLVNLLQRTIESLLFFHPAVWLLSTWVRREREACCDAVVVARTHRPHAYAELLVALAAQMPRSVLFHPAATSAMAASPLRARIRRILQLEDDPMLISGKSFTLMLAALLTAATLAVLYLPTIGQAEQSTTEVAESTAANDSLETSSVESSTEIQAERTFSASARNIEISSAAWDKLGLKLESATPEELQHAKAAGYKGGLKIVETRREIPVLRHKPTILAQLGRVPIQRLDDLEAVLAALSRSGARMPEWHVMAADIHAIIAFPKDGDVRVWVQGSNPREWYEVPNTEDTENTQSDYDSIDVEPSDDPNQPSTAEFPHAVQFEQGASKFLPGDNITVLEVRGTAETFEPGNRYWIRGKYSLASRDKAALSAFVTAKDAADGKSPVTPEQTTQVDRGEGTFTLVLPMTYRGWPHVSFYPADGGDGFGGTYLGTGESVLKVWWGDGKSADQPDASSTTDSKKPSADESLPSSKGEEIASFPKGEQQQEELMKAVLSVVQKGLIPEIIDRDDHHVIVAKQPPTEADWPAILGEPPRKERVIADKAWQRLGLKLLPATPLEAELSGAFPHIIPSGIRIIGGNVPEGLPLPSFLTKVDGQTRGKNFDQLLGWLDGERGRSSETVRCNAFADSKEYLFECDPVAQADAREETPTIVTDEELEVLREHVKIVEQQFKRVDALYKAKSRGGTPDARAVAAYELALARGELALAEGKPEQARSRLEEARTHAEEALKAVSAQYEVRQVTYDRVLEAARNLSDIKRRIIRFQRGAPEAPVEPVQLPMGRRSGRAAADQPGRYPAYVPPQAASPDKAALRYDGKTFDEWRDLWKNELSSEKRIEAVKALAAFGRAGYGKEAAATILDVAADYDVVFDETPEGQLMQAVRDGLIQKVPTGAWLPLLRERFDADPKKWERLSVRTVPSARATSENEKKQKLEFLLLLARHATYSHPAVEALVKLDPDLANEEIKQVVLERLRSKNHLAWEAIFLLGQTPEYPPEVADLLLHGDEGMLANVRSALERTNDGPAARLLVKTLLPILQDANQADKHLAVIRALAVLRRAAKESNAPEVLKTIVASDDLQLQVAAAHALERITLGTTQAVPNLTGKVRDPSGEPLSPGQLQALFEKEQLEVFGRRR